MPVNNIYTAKLCEYICEFRHDIIQLNLELSYLDAMTQHVRSAIVIEVIQFSDRYLNKDCLVQQLQIDQWHISFVFTQPKR